MTRRKAILGLLGLAVVVAAIYAVTLIRHGFSAADEPSGLEKVVARSVRELAIPSHASREANPLKSNSSVIRQAVEIYSMRCAGCHGSDGSGMTRIGMNLYPKPPDLRAGRTQSLTDGEIRYIIQNGIRLTGMPAWQNTSGQGQDDIWKLVLLIRSFGNSSPNKTPEMKKVIASASYTGSMSCRPCHQDIYDHWQKTPMANVVRDPKQHPDAIIPDISTNPIAKFTKAEVGLVYGSIWKQRYFTKIGDDYYPEPVQWDITNKVWLPYHVKKGTDWWQPYYPDDNMKRPTGPTCDGCHSVGYNIQTKQVVEWNVGCERCHGPGSEHVKHPTLDNILNPARLDFVDGNDTCIQCHSQGRPLQNPIEGKYYDWPVGYNVGLALRDYWQLEEHTIGETTFTHYADGTGHKNRMQGNDYVQSQMYRHGVTCYSCHDVHGTANYAQLRKPADQLCLDCHGPTSVNGPHAVSLEAHTHHKNGTPGSLCIDCHMPKIEKTVANINVRSHTFAFIPPVMTDKYKIPNSCNTCHTDKTTAWATAALKQWKEVSPWRTE